MAENQNPMPHSILITGRERTVIDGVAEVISCDPEVMEAELSECRIALRGSGLRIENFDSAKGRLLLLGRVNSVEYLGGRIKGVSLLQRLLR